MLSSPCENENNPIKYVSRQIQRTKLTNKNNVVNSVKCFAEVDHETYCTVIGHQQIGYAVNHDNLGCIRTPSCLNAYWSAITELGVDGLSYFLTTIFSATVDRIGVTETGRKSDGQCRWTTFGTGVMTAVNHDAGTAPVRKEQLTISATNKLSQFIRTILENPSRYIINTRRCIF